MPSKYSRWAPTLTTAAVIKVLCRDVFAVYINQYKNSLSSNVEQSMDNFTRKCLLVGTVSLAILAADTLFWTLTDLTSDWDMYEEHLMMHEEMEKQ